MTSQEPILNSSLPPSFRQIRLELAREHDHPVGDPETAYIIVAPLDSEDRIDAKLWKKYPTACRVVRQRHGADDVHGYLVHRAGGTWAFRYDEGLPDEVVHHLAIEHFVFGEYVSINEDGQMHTYRVAAVASL